MIRYAITDGSRFGADANARFDELMLDAARWADAGVEFVQLREKDLDAGELLRIARGLMGIFREHGAKTKLVLNGRADVAVAAGADGVHLTASKGELTAEQVRRVFALNGRTAVVSISCHTLEDVDKARGAGVNLILFGPVFEKRVDGRVVAEGVGLEALREACAAAKDVPVLALGGVNRSNVRDCTKTGAAGLAGIRGFGS